MKKYGCDCLAMHVRVTRIGALHERSIYSFNQNTVGLSVIDFLCEIITLEGLLPLKYTLPLHNYKVSDPF